MAQAPPAAEWLNYHHLLYFWTAVREGGISRAAERRLKHPGVLRVTSAARGELFR